MSFKEDLWFREKERSLRGQNKIRSIAEGSNRTGTQGISIVYTQAIHTTYQKIDVAGHTRPTAGLMKPPLMRLDSIVKFLWPSKTYERVFAPLRADIVHDWLAAEKAGHTKRAWYVKNVLAPILMLAHIAAQTPRSMMKIFQRSK